MDTKAYLERLGIGEETDLTPSLALLTRIQERHILTVPYENLDIVHGIPVSLDETALFNKIVSRRRGGYCFELNGLLSHLLTALGFKVESYFARFLRGEREIPLRRHRVIAVRLGNERYIADVGIGSVAPRIPLKLEEGTVCSCFGESYRFAREKELGWVLYELHRGAWEKYFSFTEDTQLDIDFIQPCFYCEKHPDSPFNREYMVAIKTPDGRRSLDGRVYKEFTGATLTHIEEDLSDARRTELLRSAFGIVL